MGAGAFGFWSYVQNDNNGDGGRILDLAGDLRDQYRMRTAEDLELFVDRESIHWGEEWERLIGDAIAGTTFFIPIITPSYFQSNACRQELLKFVREADRLGLRQLLMPVYWVTVSELEDNGVQSTDEAVKAVASHQWVDMRDVRLEDRSSAEYRKAVNRLAGELAQRTSQISATVDDLPLPTETDGPQGIEEKEADGDPGFLELLAYGDEAMEEITEIIASLGSDIQLIGAASVRAQETLETALASGKGTRAALSITERYARELQGPAERIERGGQEYVAKLAQLDSGMNIRLNVLEEQEELTQEQIEFLKSVEDLAEVSDEALNHLDEMVQGANEMSKISRSLRAPVRQLRNGVQGVLDGRAIVAEWGRRASDLRDAGN